MARRLGRISLLGAAAAAVALWLWSSVCRFPVFGWNAIRLAPSFMWQAGVDPYPGPAAGAVTTWIYGPFPIILQWPATLAHDAAAALMAAAVINLLIAVVPLAVAIQVHARPGVPVTTRAWALLLALACWPAVNLIFCQAGNAAIASGLIAGALVAGAGPADRGRLWAAAAVATLALWSKQMEFGPVLGQIAYLGFRHGMRAAVAQTGRAVATGGLFGLGFCGLFGAEGLVYNMFVIPAGLPFSGLADKITHLSYAGDITGYALAYVIVPALLVAAFARRLFRREHPWFAPVLVFACSLPFDVAGFFSVGGNINSFHAAVYLLPAASLWLAGHPPDARPRSWPAAGCLATVLALQILALWPLPVRPQLTALRQGEGLARQLPGQVYFPWNPLLTFFSDHRFYHAEDGLITRAVAGRPVPLAVVKAHFPPAMSVVAYHRYTVESYVLSLIPANAQRTTFGEWILLSWSPAGAPPHPH